MRNIDNILLFHLSTLFVNTLVTSNQVVRVQNACKMLFPSLTEPAEPVVSCRSSNAMHLQAAPTPFLHEDTSTSSSFLQLCEGEIFSCVASRVRDQCHTRTQPPSSSAAQRACRAVTMRLDLVRWRLPTDPPYATRLDCTINNAKGPVSKIVHIKANENSNVCECFAQTSLTNIHSGQYSRNDHRNHGSCQAGLDLEQKSS